MPPKKSVAPSISEVAFNCPHCGAYTTQTWFAVWAKRLAGDDLLPPQYRPDILDKIKEMKEIDEERRQHVTDAFTKILQGLVVLDGSETSKYVEPVSNLYLSKCYSCGEVAVWIHESLVFPPTMTGPEPNADLPDDVRADYNEARTILALSPRGAAALLRLAIQKLCAALGEKGKNIDDDIASLIKKGLSPIIQQSLDTVRVIGNEAVHPGLIDLRDDIDTATKLFGLVNIIAEQMITNPKHVKELYDKLPEAKRKAIDARDAKRPTVPD
jgi:hypothetical protein